MTFTAAFEKAPSSTPPSSTPRNTTTTTTTNIINKPSTTTTTTTKTKEGGGGKKRLLRFFSRDAVVVAGVEKEQNDDNDDEVVEATWRSSCGSEEIIMEETTAATTPPPSKRRGILKIKTQKESLGKPYPKPFVRLDAEHPPKEIRFSTVTIQRYPIVLGDHPSATQGPPIALDWTPLENGPEVTTVAEQFTKTPWRQCSSIRNRQKLFYSSRWTRERMLLARGYTLQQLRQAESDGQQIRLSRQRNALGYPIWLHPLLQKLGFVSTAIDPKLLMLSNNTATNNLALLKKKKEKKKQKQQKQPKPKQKRRGGGIDKELLRCV